MKTLTTKLIRNILGLLPPKLLRVIIEQSISSLKTTPIKYAYHRVGIGKCDESRFLEKDLPKILGNSSEKYIFLDVGANIGDYSHELRRVFKNASIYCFEPQPEVFEKLEKRFSSDQNIVPSCLALNSKSGPSTLFSYDQKNITSHASMFPEVITDLHKSSRNEGIEIATETLDDFCSRKNILTIDFLKIDTEGSEFEILTGAKNMLLNDSIKVIQFEFNEMNIISRVFLKDFYDLLPGFEFFRISQTSLIPIHKYSSWNEIFVYQNIIAVNPN